MEKKELWYEMLTTYRCLMRFENGITLPNMIGAYYRYDSIGQTIQRFSPEEITIKNVIAEDTRTELLYDTIADYQSRQYFLLLLVTLFASTTAITGILAIRFFLKAKSVGEELGD